MKTLIIDNYDSFTYNLVHIVRELNIEHEVHRNDKISLEEVAQFDRILLSPGPGLPKDAGLMPAIIDRYAGQIPILGICLGHQAIAEYLGAKLENMSEVFHGIKTSIQHDSTSPIFQGIPPNFDAGRYHSWTVSRNDLPTTISIDATDKAGTIMALSNPNQLYGIQFHPESVMTDHGARMIENFINVECTV